MDIKIVNIKDDLPYDTYIGRWNKYYGLNESKWANPFVIGKHGNRQEVIDKYEQYVRGKPELLKDLPELKGKTLACYCDWPKENCHGGVLIKLLKEMDNEQIKNTQVVDTQQITNNNEQMNTQTENFIGKNLLRYNKEQVYVVADLETNGLSLLHSLPWQISYCVFTLDKIISTHNEYIWWENLNMSEGAAQVTQFNYSYYKSQAKPLKGILERFEKYYLDDNVVKIWHNGTGYDVFVWNTARKSLGLKPIFAPNLMTIDTLSLARAYRLGIKPPKFDPNNKENNYDFLAWGFRMLSVRQKKLKTSLSAISKDLGVAIDESRLHSADYDIWLNQEVFKKLIWSMEI